MTVIAVTDGTGIKSLPRRPYRDLPDDHCVLEGCQFSFLPPKFRAEITLPPMKPCKSMSETSLGRSASRKDGRSGRRTAGQGKQEEAATGSACVNGCFGDFCHGQIRYPGSLKDIESSDDPWMRQARELCVREVKLSSGNRLRHQLLQPEEIVASMGDAAPSAPSKVKRKASNVLLPGRVCSSFIMEARSHPNLCRWLEENGWRLDSEDVDALAMAAQHMREDDRIGGGDISALTGHCTAGLRYRLKVRPVCKTCMCIYTIIHSVVSMVRLQGKGLWAQREQQRRILDEEKTRERNKELETQRMLAIQKQRTRRPVSAPHVRQAPLSGSRTSSLFLDKDVQEWLYSISDASPKAEGSDGGSPVGSRRGGHGKARA
eukprot:CAMPEP_0197661352 /NCGR_PEP_ID=MMETSP1338-20131121/51406_1 /TAXON_ID=43686 ORGANISM="Pelagodinium beii, Strain RCC1491" /NCGR_SAMPLE_ID=MMETSP1338 /ASSEMBLY_ACC=CAM_ASM_000754 /LENGTH=374 /DNA_ID=CAMNT_0043238893 /DNA_START=33 /DNA_END=1157 /DNA_ORIENTATION=+